MQLIQAFDTIFQVSEDPTSEGRLCLWRVKCMFSFGLELVSAFDTIFQVCAARLAPTFTSFCATFACVLRVCMRIYLSTETGLGGTAFWQPELAPPMPLHPCFCMSLPSFFADRMHSLWCLSPAGLCPANPCIEPSLHTYR